MIYQIPKKSHFGIKLLIETRLLLVLHVCNTNMNNTFNQNIQKEPIIIIV